MHQSHWSVRYVNSLFYSVQTMITVGHLYTESNIEKAFSIFLMLILAGTFAYMINGVGEIFKIMFRASLLLK